MRYIAILIKPASSLCNMRCRYCFYDDVSSMRQVKSFGMMSKDTAGSVIARVLEWADDVTFGFQGGEPTLAGLPFFQYFVKTVSERLKGQNKKINVHYAIQTNGLLIDEDWCTFFKANDFLVGLSMDGSAGFHDRNRPDFSGKGTFFRVLKAKNLFDKFKVEYNILWVLTDYTARFPQKVWNFLCGQDIRYVQFIPCLGPMEGEDSLYCLTPERFCSFYTELFILWARDFQDGRYISVKFFDDLFNLLIKREVTACGFTGQCSMQFIVEGDGSVYPCDFYVLDRWKCGNFNENTVEELLNNPAVSEFINRDRHFHEKCRGCRWWNICGGGCMRMRDSMYIRSNGTVCGYGSFLDNNETQINAMTEWIVRKILRKNTH